MWLKQNFNLHICSCRAHAFTLQLRPFRQVCFFSEAGYGEFLLSFIKASVFRHSIDIGHTMIIYFFIVYVLASIAHPTKSGGNN